MTELERVARLMHDAYRRRRAERIAAGTFFTRSEGCWDWEHLSHGSKDFYLAVAQAVLDDLAPAPLIVEDRFYPS